MGEWQGSAMAWEAGLEELLREDMEPFGHFGERRMFGGLAFFRQGNMVAGLISRGIFYRVGKTAAPVAMALPGVSPFQMGRMRALGGIVLLGDEAAGDDPIRGDLLAQAIRFTDSLPPK
ncbi:hypothetical protein CDV49_01195 [Haematobacter genomosp. 1]|uniref:TfoX N-terminal domain-containing protein n=2 Tax=Haematobacter genomosp. 1 TaxID=366618 RepID=A0A212AGA4_9RHOB|nr:hypothetical protein CDV49_01195 [Haematobacter genomosp. 1]